jgi:stage V sporulation protein D (sporulation-specific penicillin-binding protein)
VLENAMPYLGIEAEYTAEELAKLTVKVGSYRGWSVGRAKEYIEDRGLNVVVVGGTGNAEADEELKVTSQLPAYGEYIDKSSGTIYLYAGVKPTPTVAVPLLEGENPTLANRILAYRHLNIKIEGEGGHSIGTDYRVVYQSIPAGTMVPEGTVITVKFEKFS